VLSKIKMTFTGVGVLPRTLEIFVVVIFEVPVALSIKNSLVVCDTVQFGKRILVFWRNLLLPFLG
jgi:hypothetical protein